MDGIIKVSCSNCGLEFSSLCSSDAKVLECPTCKNKIKIKRPKGYALRLIEEGRNIEFFICRCDECKNEFYVPGNSYDWKPNYCPYCGIKFLREK